MADEKSAGFLAQYGAALIDAGYNIIPIKPGKKAPGFDEWEKLRLTKTRLGEMVANGHARSGVGLLTKNTPGIDLDIRDKDLAVQMEEWVHENIGMAPVRIGFFPKRLLLFRTTEPFRKVSSKVWLDDLGIDHKVEILADGQQCVAYHIHPDSGEPYRWLYKDGPLVTEAADLPTLTREQGQAVVDEFERRAKALGWTPKKSAKIEQRTDLTKLDRDDPFAADVQKVVISEDELRTKLMLVPGNEEYDTWLQIGMALYHQFDGGDRGRELWHEWSESASNYDADALDRKWDTFNIAEKGRAPVTARLIIKLAKEVEKRNAVELVEELRTALLASETREALKEAAKRAKKEEFDGADRDMLANVLKTRWKVVTAQPLAIKIARDMVRFEADVGEVPWWLKDWCFLSRSDRFFNSRTMDEMTMQGFNSAQSRHLISKHDLAEGKINPEHLPAVVALNRHQIKVVRDRLYLPGQDEFFTMNGVPYVNSYTDRSQPTVPEKLTKADKRNVEIVENHFLHLIADNRERELFKDWFCYVVQNNSRPNWGLFLQGTQGDGKSFFAVMMAAVMGAENVRLIKSKTLEGDFNGWAEGDLLKFVEEAKLQGHNRFDVYNSIKDNITNSTVEIHRKGIDPYNAPNTGAYCLFSNFRDALPLFDDDSRFFVLFSRFQTQSAINGFKATHPAYYRDLYNAIAESAGAIRGWMLKRELSPLFDPMERAPDSGSKSYMIKMNKSEEMQAIEEILATSSEWDLCRQLLNATKLIDQMVGMDVEIPQTKTIKKILSDSGYTFLGRFRVKGELCRFWSQEPERFAIDGGFDADKIREWINMDL